MLRKLRALSVDSMGRFLGLWVEEFMSTDAVGKEKEAMLGTLEVWIVEVNGGGASAGVGAGAGGGAGKSSRGRSG
jgi:hypothetical protein